MLRSFGHREKNQEHKRSIVQLFPEAGYGAKIKA